MVLSEKSLSRKVIIVGGGSRGLGKSILQAYSESNYEKIAFHRSKNIDDVNNFQLDIEDQSSLEKTAQTLEIISKQTFDCDISIHFVTGGSLQLQPADMQIYDYTRLHIHNYLVPAYISDKIIELSKDIGKGVRFNLNYYSSSVTQHNKGNRHYSAAKSGLESYFKTTIKSTPLSIQMRLYRMGMVDIQHKYFHRLSTQDPDAFQSLLDKSVPSKYFHKPDDIANIAKKMELLQERTNGLICDISGGNSWI